MTVSLDETLLERLDELRRDAKRYAEIPSRSRAVSDILRETLGK